MTMLGAKSFVDCGFHDAMDLKGRIQNTEVYISDLIFQKVASTSPLR